MHSYRLEGNQRWSGDENPGSIHSVWTGTNMAPFLLIVSLCHGGQHQGGRVRNSPHPLGPWTPTRARACNSAPINSLNHAANLSPWASVETCDPPRWHLEQLHWSLSGSGAASSAPRITQSCRKTLVQAGSAQPPACLSSYFISGSGATSGSSLHVTPWPSPSPGTSHGFYSDNTITNCFTESRWWLWEHLSSLPPSLFLSLSQF